ELAGLDGSSKFRAEKGNHLLIQRDGLLRPRRVNERRAVALFSAGVQGKLTHQQYTAARRPQVQVHFSFLVSEYPQRYDLPAQPLQVFAGIRMRDSQQHQETAGDTTCNPVVNTDRRLRDPLYY